MNRFDVVVAGGDLYDGTGATKLRADIGIVGDRIVEIGNLAAAQAAVVLDASGALACPGFIDAHSHSDTFVLAQPDALGKVFQGVTTEICGNCGASAAPLFGDYRLPSDWRDKDNGQPWSSVAEYRLRIDETRPLVNIGLLAGHGAIRAGVRGYAAGEATVEECRGMEKALARALDEGCLGMSVGLIYPPGVFAGAEELVALGRAVAARGGVLASHMRSESDRVLDAIDEMLHIGRESGVAVHLSHLKTSGRENWGKLDAALARIESAIEQGLNVAADCYPYTFSCTSLDVVLPRWAQDGGNEGILKRLRDPVTRRRLRDELLSVRQPEAWSSITIGTTRDTSLRGRALPEVARALDLHPVDAVLRLIDSDEASTSAFFNGMNEENMRRILALPYVMLGSDASTRSPTGVLSADFPHPRAYGSFTRFLRMALDGKTVGMPEAIRKMSGLAAERFGLKQRGRIARGYYADVLVVDPATLRENTTCAAPHALSDGVRHLLVNGVVSLRDSKPTGARGGCFLAR